MGQKYFVPEEKKTDVNIAVHILEDAFNHRFDRIVLVSGDSDAQPPIEWLCRVKPAKRITVYIAALPMDRIKRRLDRDHQLGVEIGRNRNPPISTPGPTRPTRPPRRWRRRCARSQADQNGAMRMRSGSPPIAWPRLGGVLISFGRRFMPAVSREVRQPDARAEVRI